MNVDCLRRVRSKGSGASKTGYEVVVICSAQCTSIVAILCLNGFRSSTGVGMLPFCKSFAEHFYGQR